MSDYTISIPDALYEKARRLAEQSAQPVDEIIRERLTEAFDQPLLDLPVDERAELQAMAYLSDDTLMDNCPRADAASQARTLVAAHGQELVGHNFRWGIR